MRNAFKEGEMKKGLLHMAVSACFMLLACGIVLQPSAADAGGRYKRPVSPETAVERLRNRLDLTDEQVEKITPIVKESMKKRHEVMDKYRNRDRAARMSMKEEMRKISDETGKQFSGILTEKQREKYLNLREERRERMDKRIYRHHGRKRF